MRPPRLRCVRGVRFAAASARQVCYLRLGWSCRTAYPVWLKYCAASSDLSMVVAEQASEAFSPHHVTYFAPHCSLRRDESVVDTLMIALSMIMGEIRVDHMIEGAFPQHAHPF